MSTYAVTNPTTGEVEKTYPTATSADIQSVLERVDSGFKAWENTTPQERAELLHKVADLHRDRAEELATIIVREMGKPLEQARGELQIVEAIYRYYADHGPALLETEEVKTDLPGKALVRKEPLGALFGIMPWNFPLYQVARFVAPNVMNGNSILLKHAPQCPESGLATEEIFAAAGAPDGLYVNVFATNEQSAEIIADPRIQGVSLTGSERAGSAVAETAGKNLKKVVLELGGNDAFLVLDVKDIKDVAKQAADARLFNNGQACNASKRFVVLEKYYDDFVAEMVRIFGEIKVGDPMDTDTVLSPLSSLAAAEGLDKQVAAGVEEGAEVLVGGRRESEDNCNYPATILGGVTRDMEIFHQELFGPVAMVFKATDEQEAVEIANDSSFGLGASVYTDDAEQLERVTTQLRTGMVFHNEPEGSAPELPFGGVRRSGVGRELGPQGMREFVNYKMTRENF